MDGICDVVDCERPCRGNTSDGRRVCSMHYQRWARCGATDLPDRRLSLDGICTVDGCDMHVRTANSAYCEAHYYRLRRSSPRGLKPLGGVCKNCGKQLSRRNPVFCSLRCSWRFRQKTPDIRVCVECGTQYETKLTSVCCSKKCKKARDLRQGREFYRRFTASPEGQEYVRQREYLRKARKTGVGSEVFSRLEIFARDGWKCGLCGKKVSRAVKWPHPKFPTIDHIVPLSCGGTHTRQNVQTAHLGCNASKCAKIIGQLRMFG